MQKFIYLIILSFLSKSAICQNSDSYFPMAVGNSWDYYGTDGLGSFWSKYVYIPGKVKKENGLEYYALVFKPSKQYSGSDSSITFCRMDDSSNLYVYSEKYKQEFITDRLNAKVGEYWKSNRFGLFRNPGDNPVSGIIVFDSIGDIGINQKKYYKRINYYSAGFKIASLQFVKGIGLYDQWYEAYTRIILVSYHIVQTSIKDHEELIKPLKDYTLYPNYPNPFNPLTNIKIDLYNNSIINFSVYDILGKKIISLYEGELKKGEHIFAWNGQDELHRNVSSGIYYYHIVFIDKKGKITAIEKKNMILLR